LKPFSIGKETFRLIIIHVAIVLFYSIVFGQHVSESKTGMVVSSTAEATQAGLQMLKKGGNAIDAAAATAFALMVTDPAMCSLGGRSQILIYFKNGEIVGIDGATQSPSHVEEPARIGHGYKTAAIPGSPAALEKMIHLYGKLPLKTILQPAIKLAKEGFKINEEYDNLFREYGKHFRSYPGSAKYFLKQNGEFYSKGEILTQPALAHTLENMADKGCGVLYRGSMASHIISDMKCNDGLITDNDLAQYNARTGEILKGAYKGFDIITRGDQCDGGSVIEMLHILAKFNISEYYKDQSQYIPLMARILHIGHLDEMLPDEVQLSDETATRRATELSSAQSKNVPLKFDEKYDEGETNHLAVIDEAGNAVSLTQSIGPNFGSKVVNPDLGFFYAYSYDMNDAPVPLQREKTSQSPTILLKDGKAIIVLGSAGSNRIPGSIVQSIINYIDHHMTPEQAIASPRVFYFGNKLHLEHSPLDEPVKAGLKQLGFSVKYYSQLDGWFGRVQAIFVDTNENKIIGVSDPRDHGAAMGL